SRVVVPPRAARRINVSMVSRRLVLLWGVSLILGTTKKKKKKKKEAAKPADPAPVVQGPPPKVALVNLKIYDKRVRVAHPPDWDGEVDDDGHWIQMIGPDGEGEVLIGLAAQPAELTPYLDGLREGHPAAARHP